MNEYDDEDDFESDRDEYHRSEERDPMIRELQAEILRLRAQLDQLMAGVRQHAVEMIEVHAKLAELEKLIEKHRARRKRDDRILLAAWIMMFASLGMSLYTYLRQ